MNFDPYVRPALVTAGCVIKRAFPRYCVLTATLLSTLSITSFSISTTGHRHHICDIIPSRVGLSPSSTSDHRLSPRGTN